MSDRKFTRLKITDEQIDFMANPSHKACHGLGYVGEIEVEGQKRRIICSCVQRALATDGDVPWIKRKTKKMRIPTEAEIRGNTCIKDPFQVDTTKDVQSSLETLQEDQN